MGMNTTVVIRVFRCCTRLPVLAPKLLVLNPNVCCTVMGMLLRSFYKYLPTDQSASSWKYAGALQVFSYQSASSWKYAGALQIFSYQSASSVKHAGALQIFSYQSASSVKHAVSLQDRIFVFPPIRLVVKICLVPTAQGALRTKHHCLHFTTSIIIVFPTHLFISRVVFRYMLAQ